MKKNVAVVLSAVVTAAVLGSCTDPKGAGEEHFIKVDDAELSFLADDSRSVTVASGLTRPSGASRAMHRGYDTPNRRGR